jgi:hypothetical protein
MNRCIVASMTPKAPWSAYSGTATVVVAEPIALPPAEQIDLAAAKERLAQATRRRIWDDADPVRVDVCVCVRCVGMFRRCVCLCVCVRVCMPSVTPCARLPRAAPRRDPALTAVLSLRRCHGRVSDGASRRVPRGGGPSTCRSLTYVSASSVSPLPCPPFPPS